MKTYLKDLTTEEIIKRLKNGEVAKTGNDEYYYKMIDGVICCYCSDGDDGIGTIIYKKSDNAYFETEEPFQIKETGFYKTREGKKAYISRITTTYIYGIITGKTSMNTWHLNGMHWGNGDIHKNDIISKWED